MAVKLQEGDTISLCEIKLTDDNDASYQEEKGGRFRLRVRVRVKVELGLMLSLR